MIIHRANRRLSARVSFTKPVHYSLKGFQHSGDSSGKDISEGGISFVSNEFLPVSSKLLLKFQDTEGLRFVQVESKVIRVSNQPYSEKFHIGARFMSNPIEMG